MQVIRHQGKRMHPVIKGLIIVAAVTAVSFLVAFAWQSAQEKDTASGSSGVVSGVAELTPLEQSQPETDVSTPEQETTPSTDEPQGSDSDTPDTAEQPDDSQSAEGSVYGAGSTVPESERVENAYFDDALFIGDSISTGIPLYNVMNNAAVVAFTGINTDNINYKPVIDTGTDEGRITMLEAAIRKAPRSKIYIMLGGNSLDLDKQTFISTYKVFLDSVKTAFPDATIYLQSMPPVTRDCHLVYPSVNNEKIRQYNIEIKALALASGVEYLDIAEALVDENGELPMEASPTDGMHFTPEYYAKWFEYLKTHTLEVETK